MNPSQIFRIDAMVTFYGSLNVQTFFTRLVKIVRDDLILNIKGD